MSKNLLKYLIKEELKKVDEPEEVEGYGKVLFAPKRHDGVDYERNTETENKLMLDLIRHYAGDITDIKNNYEEILNLNSQNKFNKLLKSPTNTEVYRVLTSQGNEGLEAIAENIGINSAILKEDQFFYMPLNGATLRPLHGSADPIQSWTIEPSHSALKNIMPIKVTEGKFICIAVSNTNNGTFFMNPSFANKIRGLDAFMAEKEVLSVGPVQLDGLVYYLCKNEELNSEELLNGLLEVIL